MSISAILFDAGDILYSKPKRRPAIVKFLTDRGHPPPAAKDPVERQMRLKAHAGKIGVQPFMEWLMAHYGVTDPQEVADGVAMLRAQQSDVVFFDGVGETLHELKRQGFKLGIVTNTFNPPAEKAQWFKTIGVDGIWDSYADSCELGVVKPDPAIYLAALEPLKISPRNAAFVGHAQVELDGAKALGMTTIRFNPDPDCDRSDYTAQAFSDLLSLPPIARAAAPIPAK
ncbi:HAD family hydrolase [Oceanibium sediminis]|uniref:HAD family hydrolase n=1 Tax=Oceanibium sediminis TaxID=2026339 RepID=UPI000DD42008|nr:HAD-IA family hydrolase [Oceanibium sediminis]